MLTNKLELPQQPKLERVTWSMKQLFPFREALNILKKKSNIYEVFAAFMLLVTAIGEIFNKHFSVYWYIITILVLAQALYLKTFFVEKVEEKEK